MCQSQLCKLCLLDRDPAHHLHAATPSSVRVDSDHRLHGLNDGDPPLAELYVGGRGHHGGSLVLLNQLQILEGGVRKGDVAWGDGGCGCDSYRMAWGDAVLHECVVRHGRSAGDGSGGDMRGRSLRGVAGRRGGGATDVGGAQGRSLAMHSWMLLLLLLLLFLLILIDGRRLGRRVLGVWLHMGGGVGVVYLEW